MSWFSRSFSRQARRRHISPTTKAALFLEMMEDRRVPAVLYYGGQVLPSVEAQALFLGNEWSTDTNHAAETHTLNSFLSDVTSGAYMDALHNAGYGVGRGTATPGAVDKTAFASGSTITDTAVQNRIQAAISSGLLQAPDSNRVYVVYVEPNLAVDLGAGQGTTRQ